MDVLKETTEQGVTEIRFDAFAEGRRIPGIFWTPADEPPAAFVCVGHTVGQHKRDPIILSVGRRFVRHHGIGVVAIDAPGHGDREGASIGGTGWWTPTAIDDMITDWQRTVLDLHAQPGCENVPLGYWGMSLGTWIGVSFVAEELRIEAAVLGLAGYSAVWPRMAQDAPRVQCPIKFFAQNHDELVRPEAAQKLFDLFGSKDKEIRFSDGDHLDVPASEWDVAEQFLADCLL